MNTVMKNKQNMFPAIPSLLNNLFQDEWLDSTLGPAKTGIATLPATNIRETENDFRIELAAPGMRKDDFKVELNNELLTVSVEREMKNETKQGEYTRKEFAYESFQRSFTLPEDRVKGEQITARYENGILEICIPKLEEAKAKPVRRITIA